MISPPLPLPASSSDSSRIKLDRLTDRLSPGSLGGSKTWEFDATPHFANLESLPSPPLPIIPGLTFVKEVGRGGMGAVYQACQESLDRQVAVKLLHGGSLAGAEERLRFRLEAEVAARIRHPNIVQVYEAGSYQGRDYLVMEWVEGGTLQQWQAGRPIDPRLAAQLVASVAMGIQAAHSLGVLHRDLKPANVLLCETTPSTTTTALDSNPHHVSGSGLRASSPPLTPFAVKVSDFGMAKRLHDPGITQTGYVVGTPHYMAPEQARGDAQVGTAADIYSLGAILYELMTGKTPFQGSAHVVLHQVIREEPPSPLKWEPGLPRDLVSICLKAMAKEAGARYASAAELAADLQRYLGHRPVIARPISLLQRGVRWARRRPAVAGLVALLLLTFLGSFLGMSLLYLRAEERREQAEQSQAQLERKEQASRALNKIFLRDFFNQASPNKLQGKQLSFVEAITRIAQDFEAESVTMGLAQFPELMASTRLQLGSTLMRQGKYELAAKMLEKAYAWYQENRAVGDEERNHCLNDLLHLFLEQGQLQRVEPLMRERVAWTISRYGPYEHPTIAAKSNLSGVLYELGRTDEAIELTKDMLEGLRASRKPNDPEALHTFSNYVFLTFKAGHHAEAERLGRACLAEMDTHLKPTHPYRMLVMNNLASALRSQKRAAEAKPLLEEVMKLSLQVNGPAHSETLAYQGNYAGLLRDLHEVDAAEKQLTDAWLIAKEKRVKHPVVLKILDGLASLAGERGKLETARVYAEELVQATQSQLDAKHQMQAQARATLGQVMFKQQHYAQACTMLEQALELSIPHGHALKDIRRTAARDLAACYEAVGNPAAAQAVRAKWK